MDIAYRRMCLLRHLPNSDEDFVKPAEIGGCDRSYHSNDLSAMFKLGLVEKKRFFIDKKSNGHWRYRLSIRGRGLLIEIEKNKDLDKFRSSFLFHKKGITARVLKC